MVEIRELSLFSCTYMIWHQNTITGKNWKNKVFGVKGCKSGGILPGMHEALVSIPSTSPKITIFEQNTKEILSTIRESE